MSLVDTGGDQGGVCDGVAGMLCSYGGGSAQPGSGGMMGIDHGLPPTVYTPLVLGLSGHKGAGKSLVADYLVKRHAMLKAPFAASLKAMLSALGVPLDNLYGDDTLKSVPIHQLNGHNVRHAAQTLGTEWGRKCMGENFWVDLWKWKTRDVPRIVADDVRFENEVTAVRNRGGYIIRVERFGSTNIDTHESERYASELPADYVVLNTGSRQDTYDQIDHIMRSAEARNNIKRIF